MSSFLLSVIFIFVIVIFILLLSFRTFVKKEMENLNFQLKDLKMQLAKRSFEKKDFIPEEKDEITDTIPEKLFKEPAIKKEPELKVELEEEMVTKVEEEKILQKEEKLTVDNFEKKISTSIPEEKIPVVKPIVKKKKTDFEKFIGENLMNKIGILILVIAIGLGIKYAIGEGWINPVGRIKSPSRQCIQVRLLTMKTLLHDFMRCAMDSFIFLAEPCQQIAVGGLKADKSVAAPESFTYKTVRPFNLSFDPGRIGRCYLWLETIV